MSLKVSDIMTRDVITIEIGKTVREAVEIMNEKGIGCLVVTKGGVPIGIVTERDVLKKIVVEGRDPQKTRIEEIMSSPLITGSPSMTLEDAAKLLILKRIKKLPIVEKGKLVGIVTLFDVVRWEPLVINILKKALAEEALPPHMRKFLK
ncbi:MAG: CBS domain-containing protein [Candidatus Baldrarchaeia archaeon]|nr:CBS domain-containing protein [Candidatus Baldrarchaeota archaeon]